jgi:hypothetical protein
MQLFLTNLDYLQKVLWHCKTKAARDMEIVGSGQYQNLIAV